MATYTKVKLSGTPSTYEPINIGGGSGVVIHTTGTSSTVLDEVWLWAYFHQVNSTTLIEIKVNGFPHRIVLEPSDSYSRRLIFDGLLVYGNGTTGTVIDGYDLLANLGLCGITGYVNRITP